METSELTTLFNNYHRKIAKVNLRFKRYLYSRINWNARIICIKGARGVGKTTMMLQHILENYKDIDSTLYASLDDLWFSDHTLIDLVDWADRHGIRRLYLDEVHRYDNWAQTLKNIYDSYPDMSIVYTSSSLLIMDHAKADLSRRQTPYLLNGLSFREFLMLEEVFEIDAVPIEEMVRNHVGLAMAISKDIKIAPWFERYLRSGYYPFYKENPEDFFQNLRETVAAVINNDLPAVESMTMETIQKIKRLLMIISKQVPFQPNLSELWKQLATSNESGLKMLYALDRAQILSLLLNETKNYKHLSKPEKIFLSDTNLMYALCTSVDKGNERETFTYNQLKVDNVVTNPFRGDFIVNDRYLLEVGGKNKKFDQIADIPDSFLVVDDTEIGYGNRIPLWLIGFLY